MEGELIKGVLMDLGYLMDKDLITNVHVIYKYNQSTVSLVKVGSGKPRSKYMKYERKMSRKG